MIGIAFDLTLQVRSPDLTSYHRSYIYLYINNVDRLPKIIGWDCIGNRLTGTSGQLKLSTIYEIYYLINWTEKYRLEQNEAKLLTRCWWFISSWKPGIPSSSNKLMSSLHRTEYAIFVFPTVLWFNCLTINSMCKKEH